MSMAAGSIGAAGGGLGAWGRLWCGMGCKIFGILFGWLWPFLGFPLLLLPLFALLLPRLASLLATCKGVRTNYSKAWRGPSLRLLTLFAELPESSGPSCCLFFTFGFCPSSPVVAWMTGRPVGRP